MQVKRYKGVEFLLQLENEQQIMPCGNNTSTWIRSTLAVCVIYNLPYMYITLYPHRYSEVLVKVWMQWNIAFKGAEKNIYE